MIMKYALNSNVIVNSLHGEIVVSIRDPKYEKMVFIFNNMGQFVFESILKSLDIKDIITIINTETKSENNINKIELDVKNYINKLIENGIIHEKE